MEVNEYKQFNIIEKFGSLIQDNIIDINPNRKTNKFVFNDFSTNEDNLPQYVIELTNISPESGSSSDVFFSKTEGNVFFEYFYKKTTTQLKVYAVSTRIFEAEVPYNGRTIFIRNKKLNVYMAEQIKNFFNRNKDLVLDTVYKIDLNSIDYAYDSGDNCWTSELTYDISFNDIWVKEYSDGALIREYSVTTNI